MNQGNRLTWIFGGALVVALVVIAFLLGRGTQPAGSTGATASASDVAEVTEYFAKVDSIQAGPSGMSADAFAQQIAADAVQGKADGFNQLQSDLDRMESELAELSPPAACREFHELTLSATGDAKVLMSDLRTAFGGGGDPANASQIAGRAQAAQEKTKRIESLRKAIEAKHGIVR